MKPTGQLELFREAPGLTAPDLTSGGATARCRLILCRTANDRVLLLFATGAEDPPLVELTRADAAWLAGLLVQGHKEATP